MIVGTKKFNDYVKAHEKELEAADLEMDLLNIMEDDQIDKNNGLFLEWADSILSRKYLTEGDLVELEETLLSVRNPNSNTFFNAYLTLAQVLADNNKLDAAETTLNILLNNINFNTNKDDLKRTHALYNLAQVNFVKQEIHSAINLIEQAKVLTPNFKVIDYDGEKTLDKKIESYSGLLFTRI